MSTYMKIATMEYPFHIGDVQESPDEFVKVEDIDMPVADEDQIVVLGQPEKRNGKYYQQWIVRDLTREEISHRKMEVIGFMFKDKSITVEDAISELLLLGLTQTKAETYLLQIR